MSELLGSKGRPSGGAPLITVRQWQWLLIAYFSTLLAVYHLVSP